MSRSLTVKPSVGGRVNRGGGNTRGHGPRPSRLHSQQTGTMYGKMDNTSTNKPESLDKDGDYSVAVPADTTQETRMQRRDAYTVIAPNERKREQISNQARQGQAAYEKHKEAKKVGYVSYVGTVGGASAADSPSRAAVQRQRNQPAASPFEKTRQYRDKARKEEDVQLNQRKQQQRRKAEQNTMRDSARQRGHDQERRAQNEAFLARLEQDTRKKQQQKLLQSSAATQQARGPTSNASCSTSSQRDGTAVASGYSHQHSSPPTSQHYMPLDERDASPVDELAARFPAFDKDYLQGLLLQMNGSVDAVCQLLGD